MQTWLVQLPPGLDVSKAKETAPGEFQIGKSTYTLTAAPVSIGECTILQGTKGGDELYSQIAGPSQLMELTKSVSLPKVDKSVKTAKPLVAQRQNLKARHFATGYGAGPEKSQKRERESEAAPTPKKQKLVKSESVKKEKKKSKGGKDKSEKKSKSEKKRRE